MAEKLSRIIRENEASQSELTKNVIQEIKKSLIEISKEKKKPDISFELEIDIEIYLPFDRKLTFEQSEELVYKNIPKLANQSIENADNINKIYSKYSIDKDVLRKRISDVLKNKSQTTLYEVIEVHEGLTKGLSELFGYISIVKEFKHIITEKQQHITFDFEQNKTILIPEIILTK